MAITVRDFTAQQDNGSLLTLNLAFPASIVAGDLLVACISHRGAGVSLTIPSGWTLRAESAEFGALDQKTSTFYKTATGSESGTEAFTSTANSRKNGYMFSIANANLLGAATGLNTSGQSSTTTPTWSGETIYFYSWDFSAAGATVDSVTGVDAEFGNAGPLDQLRMYAAFDALAATSTVTHSTAGGFTQALSFELVDTGDIAPTGIESSEEFGSAVIDVPSAILVRDFTAQQDNGSLLTLNLAFPATIVSGDLLIAAVTHRGAGVNLTTPAGWTLEFTTTEFGVVVTQKLSVYTQVADGTETGTEAFTSTDNGRKNGYMFSVRNASGIGLNTVAISSSTNNVTVVPSFTGATLYITDWITAVTETLSTTNISTEFGDAGPLAQLRMFAGFNATAVSATTTRTTASDEMEMVAIQLLLAITDQDLSPNAIPSAESFGAALVSPAQDITITGIVSNEAFGITLVANVQNITVTGIGSDETFGAVSLVLDIAVTGIASGEIFGALTVVSLQDITVTGIASEEAFGTALIGEIQELVVTSIASAEAFGAVIVGQLQSVTVDTGIASGEAVPSPILTVIVIGAPKTKVTTSLFGEVVILPLEASVPAREEFNWLTEIIISHNGTEQRTRQRAEPRQRFTFNFSEGVANKAEAFLTHYGALNLDWAIPVWTECQDVGVVLPTTSIIPLTTAPFDFRNQSLALIYESPTNFEIIEISAVTSVSISLIKAVAGNYTKAQILPVRVGVIAGRVKKANSGHSAIAAVTFDVNDVKALTASQPAQFLGDDIYFDEPLVQGNSYKQEIFSRVDNIDFDLGLFDKRNPWTDNRILRPARAVHKSPEDIRVFKQFLERRAGKLNPYWEPSFESDLKNLSTGLIGSTLTVGAIGQENWPVERKNIAILDKKNNWHTLTIISFNQLDNEKIELTLNGSLNVQAEDIVTISYLGLKRFDTDRVQLDWIGNNVMTSNINTVEIKP